MTKGNRPAAWRNKASALGGSYCRPSVSQECYDDETPNDLDLPLTDVAVNGGVLSLSPSPFSAERRGWAVLPGDGADMTADMTETQHSRPLEKDSLDGLLSCDTVTFREATE